jgi:hypothetical protein
MASKQAVDFCGYWQRHVKGALRADEVKFLGAQRVAAMVRSFLASFRAEPPIFIFSVKLLRLFAMPAKLVGYPRKRRGDSAACYNWKAGGAQHQRGTQSKQCLWRVPNYPRHSIESCVGKAVRSLVMDARHKAIGEIFQRPFTRLPTRDLRTSGAPPASPIGLLPSMHVPISSYRTPTLH